jgi:hypothetical protein
LKSADSWHAYAISFTEASAIKESFGSRRKLPPDFADEGFQ